MGPLAKFKPGEIAVVTFLLVLIVRLLSLDDLSFWYDEVVTADVLDLDWAELIANRISQRHSPLYWMALKSAGLSGQSIFWLRLPSAIADAGAAALLAILVSRIDVRAGIFLAILYAFHPLLIHYGQEARPYAWIHFFVALYGVSAAALLRIPRLAVSYLTLANRPGFRQLRRRLGIYWLGALMGGILASAIMPLGLIAALAVDVSVTLVASARKSWRFLKTWWSVRVAGLVLLSPLFIALAPQVLTRISHMAPLIDAIDR